MKPALSILTPTYNRAYTLPRLYKTLVEQTDKNFEWVVVDDGSTDDTYAVISQWQSSSQFSIIYIKKDNGGKHTAINSGVLSCSAEWIFIVDSDDGLEKNAIEIANFNINNNNTPSIGGYCYRKSYFDKGLVGNPPEINSPIILHPTKAGHYFGGDLAYIFRRKNMIERKFPIIKNEKFVPELYIWNKIGDDSTIIFYPDISIYNCEYLTDGYSKNFFKNLKNNPIGFGMYYGDQFFREERFLLKLKCAIRWSQCFLLRSKTLSALF